MTLISEVTNLQSTLPLLCYTFTDACHTGSTDWWVCCFEIDVFRVHMGNDTSSWRPKHNGLSPRFCPCTSSIQLVLQRPASLFTLTTYVSPLKANTSERNGDLQTLICVPCGETQMMSHIVESCPRTKLNGSLSQLHSADEDAVSWLTNYGA